MTTDPSQAGKPDWWRYHGTGRPHEWALPPTPPWRSFSADDSEASRKRGRHHLGTAYRAEEREVELVNAALYLRRPLLVTGLPGVGKSTLAYGVAHELGLGEVLRWNITSRTTLHDGLYSYDAMGRLHDMSIRRQLSQRRSSLGGPGIGHYITLGPLGTALLPSARPRVLLIDEIDKGDIDLPNDLLHAFETGGFEIPELARLPPKERASVEVSTWDGEHAEVRRGRIRCREFPLVVMTSNGERAFPAAFQRRCLRLDMQTPSRAKLKAVVAAHLGPDPDGLRDALIDEFCRRLDHEHTLASDQLLNALMLAASGVARRTGPDDLISRDILRPLDSEQ